MEAQHTEQSVHVYSGRTHNNYILIEAGNEESHIVIRLTEEQVAALIERLTFVLDF